MKIHVVTVANTQTGQVELPPQFAAVVRKDLIRRAVLSIQSHKRQPYGSDPEAGMKVSAELSRRRRKYRGSYGSGISRVPRKIMTRQGTRMNWVGALAPGTVGGRRAHPPKSEKIWSQKINLKEKRAAIRAAVSATIMPELVKARGHRIPDNYPFLVEAKAEELDSTKAVVEALEKMGFADELKRTKTRIVRSGLGKRRGRKYRTKVGPLLVVAKQCKLMRAARNIPGVQVLPVDKINAETLAPGAEPGRLTIFTQTAVERLTKEKLFMPDKPKKNGSP